MQDEQVVESVLAGDARSYELLVLKYQKQLYFTALNIVKNQATAEDIVQDAFIKAYEKLSSLKNRAGFYPWAKKIAINMALNHYDRAKWMVDTSTGEDGDDFFDSLAVNDTPEQYALREEMRHYVQAFIDSLPEKLRIVLVLRELDELSYEEIAEILQIPVGTVRSRLFNARSILKNRLIKQGLADGIYDDLV